MATLLEVSDLAFGYSNDKLFSKVTFRLNSGDRIALVAPNGAGKSTLLRVIAGELQADQGTVLRKPSVSFGYYRQSHEVIHEGRVLDVLMEGFGEALRVRQELRNAEAAAASGGEAELTRLASALDRYHQTGADRLEQRVEMIATRLGFSKADLERDVKTLSGGERGRLSLGVVLATEPELLVLDEPTNHLDLESIRWLEGHLRDQRGGLLVVSHDRAFLDAVCPATMELGRTSFRVFPLPYTRYHEEREVELERERRLAEEQANFVAKTEDFIRKNMAGQKTKQAQSRRKMLDKMERIERPEDVWARAERVRFRFAEVPRSGDIVLEAKGLGAERGGVQLFSNVDLLVRRGDRIGFVGPNGSGKSTLLKLLGARGSAEDRGEVRRGTNLKEGYFDQHLGSLNAERTAVDEIRSVRGDLNIDGARQYLARFRFYGDDPLRRVASFSGGERTRLALAKLLLEPRNLLFLDEPTNHLDIPAAEILEEALVGFEGTVLLVSHDRRFLENVTTRTVAFTADGLDIYEGGFKDYSVILERNAARAKDSGKAEGKSSQSKQGDAKSSQSKQGDAKSSQNKQGDAKSRDSRKVTGENGANKDSNAKQSAGAASKPQLNTSGPEVGADIHRARRAQVREVERKQKRVSELESAISKSEADVQTLREELRAASGSDWEKLHKLAGRERELTQQLERLTEEWLRLSEELQNVL